jgi:Protein of unknown function (DUF3780)
MNMVQNIHSKTENVAVITVMANAGKISKKVTDKTTSLPTLGFGVPATTNPHHFVVHIPKNAKESVRITESLGIQGNDHMVGVIDRVMLDRSKWTAIRSEVQRAFNARLKERGLRVGAWKVGDNLVDRLLGKELCVLAWAIEGMKTENIAIAVRNWLAFRPEERWWLFGMAAISTGGMLDGDKGWRLALRHALGDVAQSEALKPHVQQIKKNYDDTDRPTLGLFD